MFTPTKEISFQTGPATALTEIKSVSFSAPSERKYSLPDPANACHGVVGEYPSSVEVIARWSDKILRDPTHSSEKKRSLVYWRRVIRIYYSEPSL